MILTRTSKGVTLELDWSEVKAIHKRVQGIPLEQDDRIVLTDFDHKLYHELDELFGENHD